MSKVNDRVEERPKAPTATTLWCCPCLADVCCCCKSCYNCCNCSKAGPPCPFFYFCFPCCCCFCRPAGELKGVDEGETEIPSEEQSGGTVDAAFEGEEEEVEEEEKDELVEDTKEPTEPEQKAVAATVVAKPKAKPKPRKQARPAGKKAPKSTPTFFTGKAGGVPPPPKEACIGPPPQVGEPSEPVGQGAYLVYTDADGGKLMTHWSKTPLTGAGIMAYLRPEKEISDYKFEKKSASTIHCTGCQTFMTSDFPADRLKFYEGWASFIKQLSSFGGSIVLLPAAGVEPPPKVKIIMFNKGKVGKQININSFESLAVVPSNATKLDVNEISHSDFVTYSSSQGVYVSLKK